MNWLLDEPEEKRTVLTFDIESSGLAPYGDDILYFVGYKVDDGPVKRFYLDTDEFGKVSVQEGLSQTNYDEFVNLYNNKRTIIVGHNVKFDCHWVQNRLGRRPKGTIEDTRLLAYCADPFQKLDLASLAKKYLRLGHKVFKEMAITKKVAKTLDPKGVVKHGKKIFKLEDVVEKNKEDVELTYKLYKKIPAKKWYKNVERPLISLLLHSENHGLKINLRKLEELDKEVSLKLADLHSEIGLENPGSAQQVEGKLLKDGVKLAYLSKIGKSGHYSVDKIVLKRLMWKGNEFAGKVLEYRKYSKIKSTYIEALKKHDDGYVHGSLNQAGSVKLFEADSDGTRTGRMSSSGPNLQNIPARTEVGKRIRELFISCNKFQMFDTDLKQIEPRFVAHFSQAPKLIKAYSSGLDTHGLFASDMFKKDMSKITKMERFIGKTSWLATVYGCSPKKLKLIVDIFSPEEVPYDVAFYKDAQKNFWDANPEIAQWRKYTIERARSTGYVDTYGGRIIKIDNLCSRNWKDKMQAERYVINYKVQGSAADVMKLILIRFKKEFVGLDLGVVLSVIHDEVLGEYDVNQEAKAKQVIEDIMTNTCKLKNVPIEADTHYVNNWGEAK